jgi:hypothetical protein
MMYIINFLEGEPEVPTNRTKAVNNGQLRRFKYPIKRHAQAIKKVQEIAALTDWEIVARGALSNEQQISLSRLDLKKEKARGFKKRSACTPRLLQAPGRITALSLLFRNRGTLPDHFHLERLPRNATQVSIEKNSYLRGPCALDEAGAIGK